jgi:hypothetical protein
VAAVKSMLQLILQSKTKKKIPSSAKVIVSILKKGKAVNTVTGLEWPRGFQEIKVPTFYDSNGTGWW